MGSVSGLSGDEDTARVSIVDLSSSDWPGKVAVFTQFGPSVVPERENGDVAGGAVGERENTRDDE